MAVRARRGVQADAVVAPVTLAREIGHRHQLDRRSRPGPAAPAAAPSARERAFGRERADVQLVDDQIVGAAAARNVVGPREGRGIDDLRRAVDAVRLEPGGRVRPDRAAVDPIAVAVAGAGSPRPCDRRRRARPAPSLYAPGAAPSWMTRERSTPSGASARKLCPPECECTQGELFGRDSDSHEFTTGDTRWALAATAARTMRCS